MGIWHRSATVAYLAVFVGVCGHASSEFVSVLSGVGGPELSVWRFLLGPGGGSKIEATFSGPDPATLRRLADQAKAIMVADGGAISIKDDWRQQVSSIEPIYSPVKGQRAGISRTAASGKPRVANATTTA